MNTEMPIVLTVKNIKNIQLNNNKITQDGIRNLGLVMPKL